MPSIFATLATAQALTGNDSINVVRIAAKGSGDAELATAHRLVPSIQRVVSSVSGSNVSVREPKAEELDSIVRLNSSRSFYLSLSFLVVLAAATVAVNLAVTVAEERRPRLGVLHALGLSRRHIVLMAVLEGALYSLTAAAFSVLPGILAPTFILTWFASQLNYTGLAETQFVYATSLKPATLIAGVLAGALITLLPLLIASWRTSRMTIVSAMRNLPEPPRVPRARWMRRTVLTALAIVAIPAVLVGNEDGRVLGGVILIATLLTLARPFLPERARVTLLGAALTTWAVVIAAVSGLIEAVMPVLTAVAGLCILVVVNLRLLESLLAMVGRASGGQRAILRPPLAYICRRPVRTGLATAAFGIVLTVIVMLGVATASQTAYLQHALSYDLKLSVAGTAAPAVDPSIASRISRRTDIQTRIYTGLVATDVNATANSLLRLYVFSDDQLSAPPVPILQHDSQFKTDADVWQALRTDPGLVLSDVGGRGTITLVGEHGPIRLRPVGQQVPGTLDGIIGSQHALADFLSRPAESTVLVTTRAGTNLSKLAGDIQRAAFPQPIGVSLATDGITAWLRGSNAWVSSIDMLIGLGLVSGVLTMGILALRGVIERRHAIGVLRALGYRRRHLVTGVVAEAAITTSVGVVIGLAAGAILGFFFMKQISSQGASFAMDWGVIGTTMVLIYATLALVTISPALQISRLAPAQALRLVD